MKLTPNELTFIATVVVAFIILAGYDDKRWFRFFRRRLSRNRSWKHFRNGRRPAAGGWFLRAPV